MEHLSAKELPSEEQLYQYVDYTAKLLISKRYGNMWSKEDVEDCISLCQIKCHNAIRKRFDPARGRWKTLIISTIKNRIVDCVQAFWRYNKPLSSIEDFSDEDGCTDHLQMLAAKEPLDVERALDNLTTSQPLKALLRALHDGDIGPKQLAKALGVSTLGISVWLGDLQKALRKALQSGEPLSYIPPLPILNGHKDACIEAYDEEGLVCRWSSVACACRKIGADDSSYNRALRSGEPFLGCHWRFVESAPVQQYPAVCAYVLSGKRNGQPRYRPVRIWRDIAHAAKANNLQWSSLHYHLVCESRDKEYKGFFWAQVDNRQEFIEMPLERIQEALEAHGA